MIDSEEDAEGEPELKWQKVDPIPVMVIWQLAGMSLYLFQDLLSVLWDHVMEQQKQTILLEQVAHAQEYWVWTEVENSEMGSERSKEELEGNEERNGDGHVHKIDKGKGKERAEDGNVDGRKDGNKGGDGNGGADREMLQ